MLPQGGQKKDAKLFHVAVRIYSSRDCALHSCFLEYQTKMKTFDIEMMQKRNKWKTKLDVFASLIRRERAHRSLIESQ